MPAISAINKQAGIFRGRPALKACVFYAFGIASGEFLPGLALAWLAVAVALGLASLIFHLKSQGKIASIFLMAVLVAVGIAQFKTATSGFPPTHISHLAAQGVSAEITGEIAVEPDVRDDRTYLIIEVDSLTWRGRAFESSGRLLLKITQPTSDFSYNDRLHLQAYIFMPGGARIPGGFDYSEYLKQRDIYAMATLPRAEDIEIVNPKRLTIWPLDRVPVNGLVAPLREKLLGGYRKYLSPDHAALLAGFVLGEKRGIPADIARLFADTGTLHLMAVSGSNVAVVVLFVMVLLRPLKRPYRLLITLMAVVLFSFLTRNEPSVVRASVMAAVGLIGFYRRKDADPLGLLGFAGLILLMIKPLWLFNVGFQLSMAAAAGIVYFTPKLTFLYPRRRTLPLNIVRWIAATLAVTVAAQVAVLPITAEYFNRLPVIGIIANLPMIALAAFLTIAGLAFLPFILIGGWMAQLYAWPVDKAMSVITPLLDFFANLPLAVLNVRSPGVIGQFAIYSLIYISAEALFKRRWSLKAIVIFLGACTILVGKSYLTGRECETLTFIDCARDRAVLYSDPDGSNYLWFDCFEKGDCRQIESTLLPFLRKTGIHRIDTLFSNSDLTGIPGRDLVVGKIVHPVAIESIAQTPADGPGPYHIAESILNKRVKLVWAVSDNNIEPSGNGYYYELATDGGACILAANISPPLLKKLSRPVMLMELPWSMQPYGLVLRVFEKCAPRMLVFSPDSDQPGRARYRSQLTYFGDRTWATSMQGSIRVRFEPEKVFIDYMVKP